MAEAEKKTCAVHCSAPSGLVLRLDDMVESEMGIKRARQTGYVVLKHGTNENVDAGFMSAWSKQHEGDSLKSLVRVEDSEKK